MHGASSQWLHRITEKCRLTSGNVPVSMYFTQVRLTPKGTSCSALHATVQAWHPMQLSLSRRNPSRVTRRPWRSSGECQSLHNSCAHLGLAGEPLDSGAQQLHEVVEGVLGIVGQGMTVA